MRERELKRPRGTSQTLSNLSLPMRERELKQIQKLYERDARGVAPHAGA